MHHSRLRNLQPHEGAQVAFKDEFGAAEEREVSCEAQQGRSEVKRKLFGSCRNNMGNDPILALPEGSDNFVVMHGARVRIACFRLKREGVVTSRRDKVIHVKNDRLKDDGWSYLGVVIARPSTMWERADVVVDAWSRKGGVKPRRTDGQSERTFRTLENMFRACVRNLVVVGILTFREDEIGESKMIGLELEQETTKVVVIKERPKEAKDRQEISPWKGVVHFDKKGELAPRLFARLIEEFRFALHQQSARPSGSLASNTQPNPKGSSSKPYQPPQARNEHVNAVFTRSGMPNYGKFLKELVSNKHKLEQISSAFLSDESSAMIQNKVPPKLGDHGSFLIPCTFNKAFSCNALADLGASINLMPIDVIDEILEEYFDALLDEGSKILHSIEGTILEKKLFDEFDEFMAMTADENTESESEKEEPKF
ncbi:hypothetical protein Tco_0903050 [Tanacetum coccineum]